MTITGGEGLTVSRKTLATSSRLSTSFFWPTSANTLVPSVTAKKVDDEGTGEDDVGTIEDDEGTGEDDVDTIEEDEGTGVDDEGTVEDKEGNGADMLKRTLASEGSMLYSTSMMMENLAGRWPKEE
jgi:hypothetical protein